MWQLHFVCVVSFTVLICTYVRPHTDEESRAEEVVRYKDVKCPKCFPSAFEGGICGNTLGILTSIL